MTLMAWYNTNLVSSSGSFLIIKRKLSCTDGAYALGTGPGYVGCAFWIFSGDWKNANFRDVLSTGEWYHLAGTYDGKTIRLFLNGEEQGNTPFSGAIVSFPDTHVYLGKESCGADRHFNGLIDEAAMFNVALNEDDIKNIMNNGLGEATGITAVSSAGKLPTAWGEVPNIRLAFRTLRKACFPFPGIVSPRRRYLFQFIA
jgi:hypothetical protein